MAQSLGGRLVVGGDWRELAEGRVDVAFVCSPPVIWLEGAVVPIAAPVLADARFGGRPLYTSEVIVAAGSSFTSLEELRGARWAVNEPSSWSGYWVTLAAVGGWDHFGSVTRAGFHQRALRMVVEGAVDASAIDCHVLAVELRDNPTLAGRIRVIETLGPAPIQPVVVRRGLDPELKDELTARLLALPREVLAPHLVDRFVEAPDYSMVAAAIGTSTGGAFDRYHLLRARQA